MKLKFSKEQVEYLKNVIFYEEVDSETLSLYDVDSLEDVKKVILELLAGKEIKIDDDIIGVICEMCVGKEVELVMGDENADLPADIVTLITTNPDW